MKMTMRCGRGVFVPALLGLCLSVAGCATAPRQWDSTDLTNGLITVRIVPRIGGRVIQYKLGDYGFFWVNDALAGTEPPASRLGPKGTWLNYGGDKLWPAPQGWDNDRQWPGPPDAVLDGGPYRPRWTRKDGRCVAAELTSLPDKRSGIQFSRVLKVFEGSTRVAIDATMKNIDTKPRRWGVWAVTQFNAASRHGSGYNKNLWAYCPINPKSVFPRGYGVLYGLVNNSSFQPDRKGGIMRVNYQYRVGKIGLDSPGPWVATVNATDGYAFVHRFRFDPARPYPDKSSVEFWTNGRGEIQAYGKVTKMGDKPPENPYMMETELLSPFALLKPGQSYTYSYEWAAARIEPGTPVVDCTEAGVVCRPLRAKAKGGKLELAGSFGVFYKGAVEMVLLDKAGKPVGKGGDRVVVTPAQPLILAKTALSAVAVPAGAATARLVVKDPKGRVLGELTRAAIEP